MAVTIRPARAGDGAAIARVHVETWQAAYAGLLPPEFLAGMNAQIEQRTVRWEQLIADAAARRWTQIVAEDERGIAGFVTCGRAEGEADPYLGEVYAIYVHPRAWGQGIGRTLFEAAVDALRALGMREAILWVLESNVRARRFYERAGWRADGGTKIDSRGAIELHEVRYRAAIAHDHVTRTK